MLSAERAAMRGALENALDGARARRGSRLNASGVAFGRSLAIRRLKSALTAMDQVDSLLSRVPDIEALPVPETTTTKRSSRARKKDPASD